MDDEIISGDIKDWQKDLDEHELKQITFSRLYTNFFKHRTIGASDYNLIAKLAEKLDTAEERNKKLLEGLVEKMEDRAWLKTL